MPEIASHEEFRNNLPGGTPHQLKVEISSDQQILVADPADAQHSRDYSSYLVSGNGTLSSYEDSGLCLITGQLQLSASALNPFPSVSRIDLGFKRGMVVKVTLEEVNVPLVSRLRILRASPSIDHTSVTLSLGCSLSYANNKTARDLAVCVEFKRSKLVSDAIKELLDLAKVPHTITIFSTAKLYEPLLVGNEMSLVQLAGKMAWDLGYFLMQDSNGLVKAYDINTGLKTTVMYEFHDIYEITENTDLSIPPERLAITGAVVAQRELPAGENSTITTHAFTLPAPGLTYAQSNPTTTTIVTQRSADRRTIVTTSKRQTPIGASTKVIRSYYEPKIYQNVVNDDIYLCIPPDEGRILSRVTEEEENVYSALSSAIANIQQSINIRNEETEEEQYFFISSGLILKKRVTETWNYNYVGNDQVLRYEGSTIIKNQTSTIEKKPDDEKILGEETVTGKEVTYQSVTEELLGTIVPDWYHFAFGDDAIISDHPDIFTAPIPGLLSLIVTEDILDTYVEYMFGRWNLTRRTDRPMVVSHSSYLEEQIQASADLFIDPEDGDPQPLNHKIFLTTLAHQAGNLNTVETEYRVDVSPPEERYPPEFEVVSRPFEVFYNISSAYDLPQSKEKVTYYSTEYSLVDDTAKLATFKATRLWGRYLGASFVLPASVNLNSPNSILFVPGLGFYFCENLSVVFDKNQLVSSFNGVFVSEDALTQTGGPQPQLEDEQQGIAQAPEERQPGIAQAPRVSMGSRDFSTAIYPTVEKITPNVLYQLTGEFGSPGKKYSPGKLENYYTMIAGYEDEAQTIPVIIKFNTLTSSHHYIAENPAHPGTYYDTGIPYTSAIYHAPEVILSELVDVIIDEDGNRYLPDTKEKIVEPGELIVNLGDRPYYPGIQIPGDLVEDRFRPIIDVFPPFAATHKTYGEYSLGESLPSNTIHSFNCLVDRVATYKQLVDVIGSTDVDPVADLDGVAIDAHN